MTTPTNTEAIDNARRKLPAVTCNPGGVPSFPQKCPVCQAPVASTTASGTVNAKAPIYRCGGAYTHEPATPASPTPGVDTWGGRCASVGLPPLQPS